MKPKELKDLWNPEYFSESDLGAAERMKLLMDLGLLKTHLMFVEDEMNPKMGEWFVYEKPVWKVASVNFLKGLVDLMVRYVKESAKEAFKASSDIIKKNYTNEKELKEKMKGTTEKTINFAKKFARTYNSEHGVANALKAFQRLAPHKSGTEFFDADDWKLNVKNGYLDLRTGVLEQHKPEHYCRKLFNASYSTVDPNFYNTEFLPYMLSFFPASPEMMTYISKVLGYGLTGDTSEQKIFFLYGSGKNGKSAFTNLVFGTWGNYGGIVPTSVLLSSKGDGSGEAPTPQIDRLEGLRLVLAHEVPTSLRKINEERIKTLTGDAAITTRTLFQGGHTWRPKMKIVLDLNDIPEVTDPTSVSLRRRIRPISFSAFFQKGNDKYMHLENDERYRDALLKFAFDGLKLRGENHIDNWTGDWNDKQGLIAPVLKALREYYGNCDTISQLFEEILIVTRNPEDFMTVTRMYEVFRNEYGTSMTLKSFAQKVKVILTEKGCSYAVRHDGWSRGRGYIGVRVRDDEEDISGLHDNVINTKGTDISSNEELHNSIPETDIFESSIADLHS